jgi:hypothetical protein
MKQRRNEGGLIECHGRSKVNMANGVSASAGSKWRRENESQKYGHRRNENDRKRENGMKACEGEESEICGERK